MQTECSADLFGFARVEGRAVVAGFDGGRMTSDAGAMLLGATDRAIGLIERFAGCFTDHRAAELIEHTVAGLVRQRVVGIALGYEDLIDHDQLRHDPVIGGAGRQARSQAVGLRAAGRQIDAQPAGAEPGGALALSQDQL
jgi:Transposase DDE domain group 1